MRALMLTVAIVGSALAGCSSAPEVQANQYSLIATPVALAPAINHQAKGLLTVRRVKVADFLNTPPLVVQVGDSQLLTLPLQRWASPLSTELTALTVELLGQALPQMKVNQVGASDVGVSLVLEVTRFHLISDSQLRVAGRYQLQQSNGSVVSGSFQQDAAFKAGDYDAAVSQMRQIWMDEMSNLALLIK